MTANQKSRPGSYDKDRWLSVIKVAAYLGVKQDIVYKWLSRKAMPAHKVGRL